MITFFLNRYSATQFEIDFIINVIKEVKKRNKKDRNGCSWAIIRLNGRNNFLNDILKNLFS